MTNEELFEKINQRFIDERKVTRNIVQEEVRKETEPMKIVIKLLDKKYKKTNKLLNFVTKFYDREVTDIRKRVKYIEEHVGISNPTGLL